jgi:hypothetical protein
MPAGPVVVMRRGLRHALPVSEYRNHRIGRPSRGTLQPGDLLAKRGCGLGTALWGAGLAGAPQA